jgi:two-component system LytT family response regulator
MNTLKTVIVDDERLLRRQLRRLLESQPGITVVGEYGDGDETIESLPLMNPDLLVLDIRVPGADGMTIARKAVAAACKVIFVTAHESYAAAAFEVGAIDYILKPVDPLRLQHAVSKVRAATSPAARRTPPWLLVKLHDQSVVIHQKDIRWIAAEANYVRVHAVDKPYLCRQSIGAVEGILGAGPFCRISRSALVNVAWIHTFGSITPQGDVEITLKDGIALQVSRTYRRRLEQYFLRL